MPFDIEVDLPEHAHAARVGFVPEGMIALNIDGKSRTHRRGERYYIPAGDPLNPETHTDAGRSDPPGTAWK